ncbi:DUF4198 domain-containing protein [Vreelandella utahensis]|uniref:DUF4198 domain-containing protein n=1 Tax=Vreelandella halophila TaxID=86177 RepID=UPI001C4E1CD7|nr:DUF4198 domain-containing protein [Halomonas utahensis]
MPNHRTITRSLFPLTLLLVAASYFLYSSEVMADMFGWFKRYDVHLSPEVKGRILKDGEPVADIEVYRELMYAKHYTEKTVTDSDGHFSFPEKNIRSREPGKLLGVEHITQSITADYGPKTYLLWRTTTTSRTPEKVIEEKLSHMECDLANPEKMHHFTIAEHPDFTHNIRGICRWPDS